MKTRVRVVRRMRRNISFSSRVSTLERFLAPARSSNSLPITRERLIRWLFTREGQEKIKIKNFEFSPSSGKSHFQTYIYWPVFSSVDYLFWKYNWVFFSQCVISALFLGNMLRARKYRSVYANNVFKFDREKKRFKRGKVDSRCFHLFPTGTLTCRLHTQSGDPVNTIIFIPLVE